MSEASSSLQLGAHTAWGLPSSRRVFNWLRCRCFPHRKHDMVVDEKGEEVSKGEPGALPL